MGSVTYEDVVDYWKKHDKYTESEYNRILSNFWLLSTCHSNNIEDGRLNYHVTREVFEGSEITICGVYPRDIVEAQNSKFVRNKVISNLLQHNAVSPDLIKSFHKVYMNGLYDDRRYERGERPGEYKIHDYCVGVGDEGSTPENVSEDISKLCDEITLTKDIKPLLVASYFHLVFESIHPFSDGNGRVGRLLMNYVLMLYDHPPVNIFAEDKETYYMALEVFDRTGEMSGFVKFLKEQCVRTWKDIIESSTRRVSSIDDAVRIMESE